MCMSVWAVVLQVVIEAFSILTIKGNIPASSPLFILNPELLSLFFVLPFSSSFSCLLILLLCLPRWSEAARWILSRAVWRNNLEWERKKKKKDGEWTGRMYIYIIFTGQEMLKGVTLIYRFLLNISTWLRRICSAAHRPQVHSSTSQLYFSFSSIIYRHIFSTPLSPVLKQ